MFTSPLFRRLFLPYLMLICAAVSIVGVVAAQRLRAGYLERTEQALFDDSYLVAELIKNNLDTGQAAELNAQVQRLGQAVGCRITVVRADGTVIADNEADPTAMDNHLLRPEIVAAADQGQGASLRQSGTVHEDLMYFARRTGDADEPLHYIRLAVHLSELDRHLKTLYARVAAAALLAMAGAGIICYYFARRHAEPMVELTGFADAVAQGDLNRRILRKEKGEIGTLAAALNSMAESLGRLLSETASEKAQLLTILSSMSEGVIATDTRQAILLSNTSAASLFDFQDDQAQGRFLWEAVRSEPILRIAEEVLTTRQSRTFPVGPLMGRHLEVTICPFPLSGPPQGLVIVTHDSTQSVRYQELRKEFVANVSHELRTPLTAIKGFAETLRDGALHDSEKGPRYLATIEKHADQLTNLVNDLLELSHLESHPELPRLMSVNIGSTVQKAADLLRLMAQKKEQTLTVEIDPRLRPIAGNPDYLERAVANLLDNAIKYTPAGGKIMVSAKADADHAVVEVADNGLGIPQSDLPRIFERFYRVDRSRSREMGGTGLGLSIVKHIVQVHRGSIEVSSTPGQGSSFKMTLNMTA